MMLSPSEESGKHANSVPHVREDSEYVRLVISNETNRVEADILQHQSEAGVKSFWWWIKALAWCLVTIACVLIFLKWGVPFLFEKILLPIMRWEATAFGRPVLALVLVASLALFPVFLIPSGPSMWLAGMIFGYGFGFVIIMVGTTIGMIDPQASEQRRDERACLRERRDLDFGGLRIHGQLQLLECFCNFSQRLLIRHCRLSIS